MQGGSQPWCIVFMLAHRKSKRKHWHAFIKLNKSTLISIIREWLTLIYCIYDPWLGRVGQSLSALPIHRAGKGKKSKVGQSFHCLRVLCKIHTGSGDPDLRILYSLPILRAGDSAPFIAGQAKNWASKQGRAFLTCPGPCYLGFEPTNLKKQQNLNSLV